jgi:hypothetical protein
MNYPVADQASGHSGVPQGIRLTITSEQVKQHCLSRAEHHQGKAKWYDAEANKLRGSADAAREESEERGEFETGYSKAASPVAGLRSSAKMHAARSAWFKAVATYVEPNAAFTLGIHELDRLDLAEAFR